MHWLLFGGNGWIGQAITKILRDAGERVTVSNLHFSSFQELKELVQCAEPDRIVCCVGRTYGPGFTTIDYLEQPGKLTENLESNLMLPIWIAQASIIPTLYFGTGCIYEYDEEHPLDSEKGFVETDEPNFTGSSYSTVKRITDKIMSNFPHVINARIRMPISDDYHPRDFLTKLLSYKKITSIPNSMSVLSDILPALLACLHEAKNYGAVNAVNPGVMDHDTMLRFHERLTGKEHEYMLESLEEQNKRLASRRSNNALSADKLQTWVSSLSKETCERFHVPVPIPTLQASVRRVILSRKKD
jgi:3,5-epimerase/4-reductase